MVAPALNISRLKFLLIDNDAFAANLIREMLEAFGVKEISVVASCAEAETEMAGNNFDIILCEWELPELNGLDFSRQLREDRDNPHRKVPIIVVSAHSKEKDVITARNSGVTEYLVKPIDAETFYERIYSVIEYPRVFIDTSSYVGPDRRRKHDPYKIILARRASDNIEIEDDSEVSDEDIEAMLGL
jgi:DNA-binding response OmpR family regulator